MARGQESSAEIGGPAYGHTGREDDGRVAPNVSRSSLPWRRNRLAGLHVPLAIDAAAADMSQLESSVCGLQVSRRPIVLTVDDAPGVRDAVRIVLEEEFEVLEAAEGQAALDIVENRRVDLVLLDLGMPGLSGLTLLERLLTAQRDLKVILVTAVDSARMAVAAMKIGAADYVTKPFDCSELSAAVRHALEAPARHRGRALDAVVMGPEIGVSTSLAVVLGGRCGIMVEAAVPGALGVPDRLRGEISIDLSSFGHGLVRVARSHDSAAGSTPLRAHTSNGRAIDVRLPASFDFTGLLRELSGLLPLKPACSSRPHDLIGRVMERVAFGYGGTSVKQVSSDLHISADHLSRTFRDETAMTIKQYIVRVRVEIGKCLLRGTGDKVEGIAARVGFYDAAHFSRIFHDLVGTSPGRYRSLSQRSDASLS